jgi:hypothetical protein
MTYNKNLIDLIKKYNHKKKYSSTKQKKVYYFCCMVGGYESDDKLVHLLVDKLKHSIKINLFLYYPFKVDIKNRIKETELIYNNKDKEEINIFLENIKNKNANSNWENKLDNKWNNFLNISLTLRGFNEKINFNKIYVGNFINYGKVLNYFINDIDINIINKLRKIHGDKIESVFRAYFQMPQLMHPTKFFWHNHQALLLKENICVDYKNYNINCKKRDEYFISNLTTALLYYGDCREASLILGFYNAILEWEKFIDLLNEKKFNEIEKLIINQNRLISTNIYINSDIVYINYVNSPKYYFNLKVLDTNKPLNKNYTSKIIYDNLYYKAENHEFNVKIKLINDNYILTGADLMYSNDMLRYDINNKYDNLYLGAYLINGTNIEYDGKYYNLGKNVFNKEILQYGEPQIPLFKRNIYYYKKTNLKGKYMFLSKNIELPKDFYNVNKYILLREIESYHNRIKYYSNKNRLYRYKQYKIEKYTSYFLLEDIINTKKK